ncbi:UDP-N-acetylglucosamine 1-carboxyvinyltransferase [Anaerolineaceae bacterium oral taxon 439]|nr:UDP-N-acetylglucosamine 1-carboxyvinyltransferase [Anaerolineaceae bacterium oral taxon 439]
MTDSFLVEGGVPLRGEVTPSGNKNAALPLICATLLTAEPVYLRNVPEINDVIAMRKLLASLGAEMEKVSPGCWKFQARNVDIKELDPDLCRQGRASILLAGPLVGRFGSLVLPPPGGDVIGRRRVDTHLLAMRGLGVNAYYDGSYHFEVQKRLTGANILLDEASVTGTENAIMACVLAQGTTVLRNAASEPHVQELCELLNRMGAKISNIGSNVLTIEGVDELHGAEFTIGPDYLEVGSYIGAAVVTRGEILIRNAGNRYLDMVRSVYGRLGVSWETIGNDILVSENQRLIVEPDLGGAIPEISVMPWPAFPSDLMSIAIVIATQVHGTVLFHDWMYPSRMYFTDKLVAMGAQVVLCDPHRCIVQGPTRLYPEKLESPDIRAGMALLLATLAAPGKSTIRNIRQIERGYEGVEEKMRALGARITRRSE